jgi:hypothetical protein
MLKALAPMQRSCKAKIVPNRAQLFIGSSVKREPKTEVGSTTKGGSFKEALTTGDKQSPITNFMQPKDRAREVERTVREQENVATTVDPVIQNVK